jgi:hypothetical protein
VRFYFCEFRGKEFSTPTPDCNIRDFGCTILAKPLRWERHLSLLRQQLGVVVWV